MSDSKKRQTDLFGNEYVLDDKGNRIYYRKGLFGEEIAYDSDGKEYTTHTDFWGDQVTYSSDGKKYRSHKGIWGNTVTYGDDGSEYESRTDLFGNTVISQTRTGYSRSRQNTRPSETVDHSASAMNADPFAGLSQEQINEIYMERVARDIYSENKAKNGKSAGHILYWLSLVGAGLSMLFVLATYSNPTEFIQNLNQWIFALPVISFFITMMVDLVDDYFESLRLGLWLNQALLMVVAQFLAAINAYDRYILGKHSGKGWAIILFGLCVMASMLNILIPVLGKPDSKLKSVLKKGFTRFLICMFLFVGIVAGWGFAIAAILPHSIGYRLAHSLLLVSFFLASIYCYFGYRKDFGKLVDQKKSAAQYKYEKEQELNTSEKHNSFIKVETVNDEKIDEKVFDQKMVASIKTLAKKVAESMDKPCDSIEIDLLKGGRLTKGRFQFDGWVLAKHLNQMKVHWDTTDKPLMEVFYFDHYFVLDRNGELRVYVLHGNFSNLNHQPYGQSEDFYIRKHSLSYVGGDKGEKLIESCSALALDYEIPYQRETRKVDDEIRQFDRYFETKSNVSRKYDFVTKTGDGIIRAIEQFARKENCVIESDGNIKKVTGADYKAACAALGLSSAPKSAEELNNVYKELARLYHKEYGKSPDEGKYNEIRSAYELLKGLFG